MMIVVVITIVIISIIINIDYKCYYLTLLVILTVFQQQQGRCKSRTTSPYEEGSSERKVSNADLTTVKIGKSVILSSLS